MAKIKDPIGYKLIKPILGVLFKLYYNPKIVGKENIPKSGPILICGNHKHLYDQCGPILATKRVIRYMAKKEYFDGKFAWFFKSAGCISVNRQIQDKEAKDTAIEILKNNGAIGLFPEGTRNKTKDLLLPFKFGAVSMASKTNASIVPVGVIGDYKFRSKNLVFKIGKPFKTDGMTLEEANEKLRMEIETLITKEN